MFQFYTYIIQFFLCFPPGKGQAYTAVHILRVHADCMQGGGSGWTFLTAGGAGGDLNAVHIEQKHQRFSLDAPETQVQMMGESVPGIRRGADEGAVRYVADDVRIYIISVMGGNGSIVVVGGCFAKRGDAERIFRAADKSLFLRTVNQGSQADVLAFPQDACAFQGMKLMAAESQHVNERMPAAHVDGTGWKIAGGIDQQKAVMSFDNGADSGYILNRAGFRTGGFDTDKRAQRAVFLQDIMKIKRVSPMAFTLSGVWRRQDSHADSMDLCAVGE